MGMQSRSQQSRAHTGTQCPLECPGTRFFTSIGAEPELWRGWSEYRTRALRPGIKCERCLKRLRTVIFIAKDSAILLA